MYAEHRVHFPYLFWRETTPQHFTTPDGVFRRNVGLGAAPYTCLPIPGVSLQPDHSLHADWEEQVHG